MPLAPAMEDFAELFSEEEAPLDLQEVDPELAAVANAPEKLEEPEGPEKALPKRPRRLQGQPCPPSPPPQTPQAAKPPLSSLPRHPLYGHVSLTQEAEGEDDEDDANFVYTNHLLGESFPLVSRGKFH